MSASKNPCTHRDVHTRRGLFVVTVLGLTVHAVNLLGAMFALYIAQWFWGDDGLGYYSQVRRLSSVWAPLLTLGQSYAIVRYLAFFSEDEENRRIVALGSSLLTVLPASLVGGLCLAVPEQAARWLMGSRAFVPVVAPMALALVGKAAGLVGASYLRGRFRYIASHLLTLAFSGAGTCAILLAMHRSPIFVVLWYIGLFQLLLGCAIPVFAVVRAVRGWSGRTSWLALRHRTRELAVYGFVRMPSLGLMLVLTGFASWQAASHLDLGELGFFNATLAMATTFNLVAAAMSFTVLPLLSCRMASAGVVGCHRIVEALLGAVTTAGIFLSGQLFFFGPALVQILLQRSHQTAGTYVWGLPFLVVFGLLISNVVQNILDAYSSFPFYLIALAMGTAAMLACWLAGGWFWQEEMANIALSFAIGYGVVGLVGLGIAGRLFRVRLWRPRQIAVWLVMALFAAVAWWQMAWVRDSAYTQAAFLVLNSLLAILLVWFARIPWLRFIVLGR